MALNTYEVEKILDKKVRNKEEFYLVKWKGYPTEENTWEPSRHLVNCWSLVEVFERTRAPHRVAVKAPKTKPLKRKGSFSQGDSVDCIKNLYLENESQILGEVVWEDKALESTKYPIQVLHDKCPKVMCEFYFKGLRVTYQPNS